MRKTCPTFDYLKDFKDFNSSSTIFIIFILILFAHKYKFTIFRDKLNRPSSIKFPKVLKFLQKLVEPCLRFKWDSTHGFRKSRDR